MKNVQIIDGASNATFSLFQATDEEFDAIFPHGSEMEIVEDVIDRLGEAQAGKIISPMWGRPILKRDAMGLHGTLYYDSEHRKAFWPSTKREMDLPDGSINPAQRMLFAKKRG